MADAELLDAVRRALAEDRARDDVTTALLDRGARAGAAFVAEQPLVAAGVEAALAAVRELDPGAELTESAADGAHVAAGGRLRAGRGSAAALLSAERVALNFLQRLCGVATLTRRAVDAVAGTSARITHTRKTTPGLRRLEIAAVLAGGGVPNRSSLADAVMWKDNHWAMLEAQAQRRTDARALRQALARVPDSTEVVVEVESPEQLEAALACGVRHVLVDNRTPEELASYVRKAGSGVTVQASGGITLENVRAYAEAGAGLIAIGALTHSAPAAAVRCDIFPAS